jgi:ubiquinone/menaquinone biosynthesis C-methylase UbiE
MVYERSQERVRHEYYDLIGRWNTPIAHMGSLSATEELLEMCQIETASTVLEVGCGTGLTACNIGKKYKCHVVGVDYSEEMISRAKKRAQKENVEDTVEFRVANVFQLPFDDGIFDVAFFESLLNILVGDKQKALNEISRVVQPGGRIGANEVYRASSTPAELLKRIQEALEDLPLGPGGNLGRFSPEEWKKCFEASGLQQIQMVEKQATKTPVSAKDMLKTFGIIGFISFALKTTHDLITSPQLRMATKSGIAVRKMMHRDKNTRKYFGYLLIVGQNRMRNAAQKV